jgi:hypothetical protein
MHKTADETDPVDFPCPNYGGTVVLIQWACFALCQYGVYGPNHKTFESYFNADRRCSDVCCKKVMSFCWTNGVIDKSPISRIVPLTNDCNEVEDCKSFIGAELINVGPCTVSCPER